VETSVFSPDGRQVAYLWFVEKDGTYELRIVPLAAGTPPGARTVLRFQAGGEYTLPVAWPPDGRRLIVERLLNRASQLGTVSIEDGSFQSLKSLEWRSPGRVSVSPDGRFLAYDVPESASGSSRDIKVLATDGSRETTLVQHPADDTSPVWSPDGSHVLFLSTRTGAVSLWSQAVAGGSPDGSPTLIRSDLKGVSLLGMSRSGALYYHLRGGSRQNVYVADLENLRVTRPPVVASESGLNVSRRPAWSRDGQYLAYYSSRSPSGLPNPGTNPTVLVIRTVNTGVERVVPLPVGVVNNPLSSGPKWFPDNRSVLILARDAQGPGLGFHRLDLDTARTQLLWSLTHNGAFFFDLSPDGTAIFCAFQHGGQPSSGPRTPSGRLVRFDLDTRRETVLKKDEWFVALAVSPDGSELAYLKTVRKDTTEYPSFIEVMPAAGGPSREVYRHSIWLDGSRYNTLAWTPDQRSLLFVRGEGEGENRREQLWRVPIAGGPAEQVGVSGVLKGIKTPAMRPDGKQLAFGLTENDDNEIWALENFLPAIRSASK